MENYNQTFVFTQLSGGEDVLCGILSYPKHRRSGLLAKFSYVKSYLMRAEAIAIDPALPLNPNSISVEDGFELFGGIRDAAPDGWGRHLINRALGVQELSDYDYVIRSSDDRVGALSFGPTPDRPKRESIGDEKVVGEYFKIESLLDVVDQADSTEILPDELKRSLIRGSSALGGARPKGTTKFGKALWLAKFSRKDDKFNAPLVEYANMTLARKAGLNVPELDYKEIPLPDGRIASVFLIKRFDRIIENNKIFKIPFWSSLTILKGHESDYNVWSYADVCDQINKYSKNRQEDIIELYKRMVFNIATGNTDDHLRNHGFLYDINTKTWNLSPLYDVVPVNDTFSEEKHLFLQIVKSEKDRTATIANALKASFEFGLTEVAARKIIDDILNVTKTWREHYKNIGVQDADIDRITYAFTESTPFDRTGFGYETDLTPSELDVAHKVSTNCVNGSNCKNYNSTTGRSTKLRGSRKAVGICSYCDDHIS